MEPTLVPAYGRDYRSAAAARAAFLGGADWRIAGMHPDAGRYATVHELAPDYGAVRLRYRGMRRVIRVCLGQLELGGVE